MNLQRSMHLLEGVKRSAWMLFLLFIPVTSFPYFPPAIGGAALVRPLSLYPLLILIPLVTIPRLFTKRLPKTFLALLAFVLLALASSAISLLRDIEPVLGIAVGVRTLRALLTLGIGCAFYLTIVLSCNTSHDLEATLRWIYRGMGIAMFVGSLQALYVIHFTPAWYELMNSLQKYISIRRLINNRISGMTYEPNWFAEQIIFLLLPWLLSSVLSGHSVFRPLWRKLTVEWLLLIWSLALLPLTFSRAGVLNMVILVFMGVLFFRPAFKTSKSVKHKGWSRRLIETGLFIVVISGVIFAAGTRNEFFSRLWSYWFNRNNPTLSGYFKYLGFSARFIYSETAYNTFTDYPVFGVGLGNYAFFFDEQLPDRPLNQTPEVLRLITPEEGRNRLITPKNFALRLLAETGLIGTAAFAAFLLAILGCGIYLWLSPFTKQRFWGIGSLLGFVAFLSGSLTYDSFAQPTIWVVFGLTTAAAWVTQQEGEAAQVEPPHL